MISLEKIQNCNAVNSVDHTASVNILKEKHKYLLFLFYLPNFNMLNLK